MIFLKKYFLFFYIVRWVRANSLLSLSLSLLWVALAMLRPLLLCKNESENFELKVIFGF